METIEYIQADRKREEHRGMFGYRLHANGREIYRPGPRTGLIKRCDLYVDLDVGLSCEPSWWSGSAHAFLSVHKLDEEPERPTFQDIGEPERGYVVLGRSTTGASVLELEVTHLSTAAIDPTLFEVPAGFSLVEQIRQDPVPPLVIRLKHAYERLRRHLASTGRRPRSRIPNS